MPKTDSGLLQFAEDLFSAPVLSMEFEQQEGADSEDSGVFVSAESGPTIYSTSAGYDVLLINKVEQEYVVVATSFYDEQPDLKNLPPEFFNPDAAQPATMPPSWENLAGFLDEPKYIGDYIDGLTESVLTQTDPTVPEKITQLLNYLPSDDPDAQPYIEHLTYLLGYFYELRWGGRKRPSVPTSISSSATQPPRGAGWPGRGWSLLRHNPGW
jgi:hypothetical protein